MIATRATRAQLGLAIVLLVLLQFYVRPRFWSARSSPDFALIGLILVAMRIGPGLGALVGFLFGVTVDALTPARFGAAALAHTVVGYLAASGRAVFFADNLLVNAGFVAVGLWLRDLIVLLVSGAGERSLLTQLTLYGPLQALSTALFTLVLLVAYREWLSIRLDA